MRIKTIQEYETLKAGRLEPLCFPALFEIDPVLKAKILKAKFPKASPENDQKFYQWMWDISQHWCEECGTPLKSYWSGYISHIKTRGAHTELRYDPLNVNILCNKCHSKWETGTSKDRKQMFIYHSNKLREPNR